VNLECQNKNKNCPFSDDFSPVFLKQKIKLFFCLKLNDYSRWNIFPKYFPRFILKNRKIIFQNRHQWSKNI